MKLCDAKSMTKRALQSRAVHEVYDCVEDLIIDACKRGDTSVTVPFSSVSELDFDTKAVMKILRLEGYKADMLQPDRYSGQRFCVSWA